MQLTISEVAAPWCHEGRCYTQKNIKNEFSGPRNHSIYMLIPLKVNIADQHFSKLRPLVAPRKLEHSKKISKTNPAAQETSTSTLRRH